MASPPPANRGPSEAAAAPGAMAWWTRALLRGVHSIYLMHLAFVEAVRLLESWL